MKKIILISAILLLLLGCVQNNGATQGNANDNNSPVIIADTNKNNGADGMKVENGSKVKVEYIGKLTDGTVFDKSEGRGPLEFTAGAGNMIAGFDEAVIGMKLNEEKTVTIPPEKAYGKEGSGQMLEVPLSQISSDTNLTAGIVLTSDNGTKFRVVEIKDGTATLQAMHQLEGKTLVFWIKVVSIDK